MPLLLPLLPLPLVREEGQGDRLCKRGFLPHKNKVFVGTPVRLPLTLLSLIIPREFREALAPLKINLPLSLVKGKGTQGIGLY